MGEEGRFEAAKPDKPISSPFGPPQLAGYVGASKHARGRILRRVLG